VHDIGNLTLTYDNSALSNRPFNDVPETKGKRSLYDDSKVFMEKQIADYDDWTLDEIQKRREKMKTWTLKRWHVEKPSQEEAVTRSKGKFSMANIESLADERGVGDTYHKLLACFKAHGIGLRAWRWCITFTPPGKRQFALGAIWPKQDRLHVGVWRGRFTKHFGLPREEVNEVMDDQSSYFVNEQNVDDLIERLERLFESAGLGS
jgi:hypothetical protein